MGSREGHPRVLRRGIISVNLFLISFAPLRAAKSNEDGYFLHLPLFPHFPYFSHPCFIHSLPSPVSPLPLHLLPPNFPPPLLPLLPSLRPLPPFTLPSHSLNFEDMIIYRLNLIRISNGASLKPGPNRCPSPLRTTKFDLYFGHVLSFLFPSFPPDVASTRAS